MINFFYSLVIIYMTTYAERLARRTRNTFAPAKTFFKKVSGEAPTIFKKVQTGAGTFFNKTLPSAGRQIGRGMEQVGGTISKVANSPITQAITGAVAPELLPGVIATGAIGQGIRQSGGLVKSGSQIGTGLSRDRGTAEQQILERAKNLGKDANQITFK